MVVKLVTSDNETFETEKDIIIRSVLIRNMLEGMLIFSTVNSPRRARLIFFLRCRRVGPAHPSP